MDIDLQLKNNIEQISNHLLRKNKRMLCSKMYE